MLEEKRIARQEQLASLLYRLAQTETGILDENGVAEETKSLKEIYKGGFRHQYSDLFPVIKTISSETAYDTDALLENLRLVRECVEAEHSSTGKYNGLYLPLLKLLDHINLELARLGVYSVYERNLGSITQHVTAVKSDLSNVQYELSVARSQLKEHGENQEQLSKQLETAQKTLNDANQKAEALQKQAENLQTQLVSVLSIFAAIVIAFSGGVNFLGNAISSIQNVIIYKSVLVCTLCGLVLFNTIFLMLYIVGKIINRSIFAHCSADCGNPKKTTSCQCSDQCHSNCKGCKGFVRIMRRLPYVFWVNAIGLVICMLDVITWYLRLRGFFPFDF